MTGRKRFLVAAALAMIAAGGMVSLFVALGKSPGPADREETPSVSSAATPARRVDPPVHPNPEPLAEAKPAKAAPMPKPVEAEPAPKPVEQPIEEVLGESGEDPRAVFFMSRVREAIQEGNRAFARELLRQMKEEHASSVLVEEAEALFE
jgi:hypothetical protein